MDRVVLVEIALPIRDDAINMPRKIRELIGVFPCRDEIRIIALWRTRNITDTYGNRDTGAYTSDQRVLLRQAG